MAYVACLYQLTSYGDMLKVEKPVFAQEAFVWIIAACTMPSVNYKIHCVCACVCIHVCVCISVCNIAVVAKNMYFR